MVNLTSNDVQRFEWVFNFIHFLWISPVILALYIFLVYQEIGWPAIAATVIFAVLQIPLETLLAHCFGRLRYDRDNY